jgi:very-short-patch-repair endonuclease
MSSKIFLQSLQSKLKGGNARSIHLNALPGRLATRLDLQQFELIMPDLANQFLLKLLSQVSFEFNISFDEIDLNQVSPETQKKLSTISKRLNSIIIENEDYYKEHGIKTLGFGYPILIKRSAKDPTKIIKAPLFIWPLEALKSKTKVNEWTIARNKVVKTDGKLTEADVHSVSINEVLFSFIKGEDGIALPNFTGEALEDSLIDKDELLSACADVLAALNSGSKSDHLHYLHKNFETWVQALPDASQIDSIANNKAYIHFGGIFGLFRAQKESIITDISKLIDRFDEFQFDNLVVEHLSSTPFSAVETDPSQQAILTALGTDANQIIQGPPGTGKSQSLTALITNSLANGLKCLVVCEKKTALDVIKRNLERTSPRIGALVGVIDDVNDDREAIVDSVRDRQNGLPGTLPLQQAQKKYDTLKIDLQQSVLSINSQHQALMQRVYGEQVWSQLVGRYLHLKAKYEDVPLKNVLNYRDFDLQEKKEELAGLLKLLKQGNILYDKAEQYQNIFAGLTNELFTHQSAGEARAKIEQFVAFANPAIREVKKQIDQIKAAAVKWQDGFLEALPNSIVLELNKYFPFLLGETITTDGLPEHFVQEEQLVSLQTSLDLFIAKAFQIQGNYKDALQISYDDYYQKLNSAIADYLSFADNSVLQYGNGLLNNSGGAKFMTGFLGLFSDKHRRIKQIRLDIRTKVAGVRNVHGSKNYISHQYNDNLETADLTLYLNNVKELHQKMTQWEKDYPATIDQYLADVSEKNFHQEFSGLKLETITLLREFKELAEKINSLYKVQPHSTVADINSLITAAPIIKHQLKIFQDKIALLRVQFNQRSVAYANLKSMFVAIENWEQTGKIVSKNLTAYPSLGNAATVCEELLENLEGIYTNLADFREYHEWRSYFLAQDTRIQKHILEISSNWKGNWSDAFECWYLFWVLSLNEPPRLPKGDHELVFYQQKKREFNTAQLDSIISFWGEQQNHAVKDFKARGLAINSLFNKKGSKGMRRNALRSIVKSEFDLFTDFFPVLLLNPSVCSSILPLEEGVFDVVIFDEASQLRLEDTFAALIRGKAKIVSGDKHQMAPSSYFEGGGALLDPIDEEEQDGDEEENISGQLYKESERNLADSESLLGYAIDKGFKESYLNVHYRSQHPFLIDFSNQAFYGGRLIPVPAKEDYIPIEFVQVNGSYEGQVNKEEAAQVVALLKQIAASFPHEDCPTIGVATFNIYQRNLILEEIGKEGNNDPVFKNAMAQMAGSLFVKNLENIQGDERDIIIISTTFGKKADGKFTQHFGPIIQDKGHRMLNVIITRARQKVYLCTSFPSEAISQYPSLIQQKGNKGRGILYAYLTYARAVSEGNHALREAILKLLGQHCTDKQYDISELSVGSESPFEDEVYERLAQHIGRDRIIQQYKIGGFRIDMVILDKHSKRPVIALECDGAKYHGSPEAYAWDSFRQKQLEQFGFYFYRLWSTKWWDAADRELQSLLKFIADQDAKTEATGS